MKNKRLEYFLNSYLAKTITAAEENEMFILLSDNANDKQVKEYMDHLWDKTNAGHQLNEERSQKILSHIFNEQQVNVVSINNGPRSKRWMWAAASIALLVSTVSIYYLLNKGVTSKTITSTERPSSKYKNDVQPGSNGAILKLADGSTIVLDSVSNGTLSKQGNILVIKNGGSLNYIQGNGNATSNEGFNIIETPKGKQFEIALEDGTKVWLNAASSIRFPVIFDSKERRVEITGEAYFEVTQNANKPFRVAVNGTTVEVLGTHFNINSYNDEASLNTTLLEGSVKVMRGSNTIMLSPGQQAQVNKNGAIAKLQHVNTVQVVAWKNNSFSFNNTDLKQLMRQLARWYDVDIEYKNDNSEPVKFNGDISRTVTLSNVLKMLELTGEVSFGIEGKKIIVSTEN